MLTRQGHLVEEEDMTCGVADAHGIIDPDNVPTPLQAASCTYRIALGRRAGRKVLSWRCAAPPSNARRLTYAATSPARPSPRERLNVNHTGRVVLKLKTPYRYGMTHLPMSPLGFMQRLAALMPRMN